ncbi:hypothetical protein I6A60_31055 [Frankia sp. AgB1.9]|uniref:hypothetical protein n=1 Tax=unclassified Frankia TaxID=2632575 RepID=UPI00193437BE|nr:MULTISPECIES: hypothetical protein [unclassified Frankia]MBL7552269.1 hypothetical protein [Frankia sp. AgB1.9]MBL7625564.1 hypothetical protein [Frankia sp. AgB1.8]
MRTGACSDGGEAKDAGFFSAAELEGLNIHPSMRIRVRHYLDARPAPYIGQVCCLAEPRRRLCRDLPVEE